ncbi:hypothetical protein D3C76_889140 [compost metagenome]
MQRRHLLARHVQGGVEATQVAEARCTGHGKHAVARLVMTAHHFLVAEPGVVTQRRQVDGVLAAVMHGDLVGAPGSMQRVGRAPQVLQLLDDRRGFGRNLAEQHQQVGHARHNAFHLGACKQGLRQRPDPPLRLKGKFARGF